MWAAHRISARNRSPVGAGLPAMAIGIYTILGRHWSCGEGACSRDGLTAGAYLSDALDSNVGAGLPAKTACQPTGILDLTEYISII